MKNKKLDIFFLIFSIIIIFLSLKFQFISKTFLGIYFLILNIRVLFNCKKNNKLFTLFLCLLYFNYSFLIARYIGNPIKVLSNLFNNISVSNTYIISIDTLILFYAIINFIISGLNFNEAKFEKEKLNFRYRKILVFLLETLLVVILFYHLYNKINVTTTLLEYSVILFIFLFYFTKDYPIEKAISEVILLAFAFYSLKNGDRIAVLQLILSDFMINYVDKFSKKGISISILVGILSFTFLGVYGDLLDTTKNFDNLNLKNVYDALDNRRFALDTSIAAYHSGLTIIESTNYFEPSLQYKNGSQYFINYSFLGSMNKKYEKVPFLVRIYGENLGGGFITSYFYFWFKWLGVILIAIYIAKLIKIFITKNNLYVQLLAILFYSTFPRWYMYAPDFLFRGIILFSFVYFGIYIIFIKKDNGRRECKNG